MLLQFHFDMLGLQRSLHELLEGNVLIGPDHTSSN